MLPAELGEMGQKIVGNRHALGAQLPDGPVMAAVRDDLSPSVIGMIKTNRLR